MVTVRPSAVTIVLFLSLLPLEVAAQGAAKTPAVRIAEQYLGTVATVVALDANRQPLALGSGFFLSERGELATNAHVIQGSANVAIRWGNETKLASRVVRFDDRYDLVVLDTAFSNTRWPPLGDAETVVVGEEVVVLGNPHGFEGTVSTGIVSGVREIAGLRYLQITAPVSPGSSGGPVFNVRGHVIGITTASVTRGQNLNFAVPVNLLRSAPTVSIAFSQVRAKPIESERLDHLKDLVRLTNVKGSQLYGYWDVTFSVQNDTGYPLEWIKIILIVYVGGQVLNYKTMDEMFREPIPPGLAKQTSISAAVSGHLIREEGHFDLRVLDFRLSRTGSSVEPVFKGR